MTSTGSLAERLRQARTRAGISQDTLAKRAGTTGITVSRIERGKTLDPEPQTLADLARALGTTEQWLRRGEVDRAAAAVPDPQFWPEFLKKYSHLAELSAEDLEGVRVFAARHLPVQSWTELERMAELVRTAKLSATHRAATEK